jgi:hypothetical protein
MWKCLGSGGGTTASCTAPWPYADGVCGPAAGVATATPPTMDLCSSGITMPVRATGVTGLGPWAWTCAGSGGGTFAQCTAPLPPTGPDGHCGSANDVSAPTAPAMNLCSVGAQSAVTGSGPWSWSCSGVDGGALAYCFAPSAPPGPVGTLQPAPAGGGHGTALLLTDGTVMVHSGGINTAWSRLTPDSTGSYANGTWSQLPGMHDARLYFASVVLPDGRVLVGGGEYPNTGPGRYSVEIYDPITNAWSYVLSWSHSDIGDSTAKVLRDGRVLLLPRLSKSGVIYDPANDTWTPISTKLQNDGNDEESVVQLPDGSMLVVSNNAAGGSQRYLPATDQWVSAGLLPAQLVNSADEIGPGMLLYDGRALYLGGTGHTAFYTPSTSAWLPGPDVPQALVADDVPAAVLPNGHVLFTADSAGGTIRLFDFDPVTLLYTDVGPGPGASPLERMLVLPTGQVLVLGPGGNQLFTPNGAPNAAWKPTISSVSAAGMTRTVTGVQLNGLTESSYYGDDAQQSTNYPLFRLVDAAGKVFYARSSGFSSMGVAPGLQGTATMSLAGIPSGTYSLSAVANGIASAPVSFTVP